ncbi:hypothetical protein Poli38472_000653 [Pythium oligandrum]|uniref:JmjC domain-containing protein n=1 Tax=Pythium oligandrum TaxID=41045 RepID=A0A8K1CCW9_PYTOL|nr:hypothetical protein Poli38472_000653 [Pythium oligandrum]|eukprot:TMW60611.1 hypothetical protein Poli38472_000653 [Pythium oligandrum]
MIASTEPTFLKGFARECVHNDQDLALFEPGSIHTLAAFQSHRDTVVDVACKDKSGRFYSGDHRARQSVEVKFGDFLDYYQATNKGEPHWLGSVEDLEFYLCQCPIAVFKPDDTSSVATLPNIMQMFKVPNALAGANLTQTNLWIAVNSSRTSVHYDAYRNVLVVLHGTKTVTLYPPSDTGNLYSRPIFSKSSNHSEVNFAHPDLSQHPAFANAHPQVFKLEAGDALYIPEGWWHQVDTSAYCIAINYWFDGLRAELVQDPHMTTYYARVAMEELVRLESSRILRQFHEQAAHTVNSATPSRIVQPQSQTEHERMLMSLSEQQLKDAQVTLASSHPDDWRALLENASVDFAAYLADHWDRQTDQLDWLSAVLQALGEHEDRIKQHLLEQQEAFQHKIFKQVVEAALGRL